MKGLILAGGKGTRLFPSTAVTNKHLLHVWDRPMIDWALVHLANLNITDPSNIGIVVGEPFGQNIKNYLGPNYNYIDQGGANGIGNAVYMARSFVQDAPFVVHLGDQIYTQSLMPHYDEWQKKNSDIHIILRWYEHANKHTVVLLEKDQITGIIEKPQEPEQGFVMIGMSFYKPVIFELLKQIKPGHNNEYQLSEAVALAIKGGLHVSYSIQEGEWVDAGTPENLLKATIMMKDQGKNLLY